MHNPDVARRAKQLGIRTVPAVLINGTLAACCTDSGPDEATLRVAGLGQAL
jgi:glutaredoxin 3